MNGWGKNMRLSLFGQSHGEAVGIVVDGVPAGMPVDLLEVQRQLDRRAPGKQPYATARKEADQAQVVSGIVDGVATGFPICALIWNKNARSGDYAKTKGIARPGHADFTAMVKYHGFADMRGGGHFSGRLTAPLVFAGAIARQLLAQKGVCIGAHIAQIAGMQDGPLPQDETLKEALQALSQQEFPLLREEVRQTMQQAIQQAKAAGDSVGGVVECAAAGVPAGWGEPFFYSVESALSSLLFSIPAVKGVEFGEGFGITSLRGSQANDSFYVEHGNVKTRTNHNGGINGGITNGMPVVCRVAIKPTPSIYQEQDSVDMDRMENARLQIQGRHDPCIVPRALPVVEAAMALALADLYLEVER